MGVNLNMEQMLLKLARQLDSLDEASLTFLWEKYANIVNAFEPTQRWQEAVLVLSFIQAKRWKNQLFNSKWSARIKPENLNSPGTSVTPSPFTLETKPKPDRSKKAKVLRFSPPPAE